MKNVNRGEEEDKNSGRFIHGGDQSLFGIGKLKSGVEDWLRESSESMGVECRLELSRGLSGGGAAPCWSVNFSTKRRHVSGSCIGSHNDFSPR